MVYLIEYNNNVTFCDHICVIWTLSIVLAHVADYLNLR